MPFALHIADHLGTEMSACGAKILGCASGMPPLIGICCVGCEFGEVVRMRQGTTAHQLAPHFLDLCCKHTKYAWPPPTGAHHFIPIPHLCGQPRHRKASK